MILTRIGKMDRVYTLADISKEVTEISCNKGTIVVYHNIEKLAQSWYNWQYAGMFIQRAFPYLSDADREFILTGITSTEWERIFNEDKESE